MSRSVEAQGLAALLNLDAHIEVGRISAAAEQAAARGAEKAPAPPAEPSALVRANGQSNGRQGAPSQGELARSAPLPAAALQRAPEAPAPLPLPPVAPAALGSANAAIAADTADVLGRVGPYELKAALAHDGLGQVYKAWDSTDNVDVMLTLLDLESDARDREVIIAQLQKSVMAASRLRHPGLARIHDAGVVGAGVYIVNEWLPGRTLARAQLAGWQPTARVAATLVRDLAQALAHAHAQGVLHGGLNPSTVMLDAQNKPTVLGLGFACPAHASDLPSMDPLVSGAAPYLAPEQLQGGAVDVRTDVHALGVLLYELLAGNRAYPGETVPEVARALMAHDPAPPHWLRLDVPERLSAIAMQALQRNPAARYAQTSDVALALNAWLDQADQESDDAREAFVAAQTVGQPVRRKSPWLRASALAAAAAVAAFIWVDRQDAGAPAAPLPGAATSAATPAATPAAAAPEPAAAAAATVPSAVEAAGTTPAVALEAGPSAVGTGSVAGAAAVALASADASAVVAAPSTTGVPLPGPAAPGASTLEVAAAAGVRSTATSPPAVVSVPLSGAVAATVVPTAAAAGPAPQAVDAAQHQPTVVAQATFAGSQEARAENKPGPRGAAPGKPAAGVVKAPAAANNAKTAPREKTRPTTADTRAAAPAAVQMGTVVLAVSPWGYVEVGGKPAGPSPPLQKLTLPEGTHTITVRNEDFAPYVTTVQVTADKSTTVRHRFSQ